MACRTKTYQETANVWSDGTTTTPGLYHSMMRLRRAEWAKARVSLIVEGSSGSETVSTAVAYGDDESDFDNPTVATFPSTPTSVTGNDTSWGTEYASFDASKQLVDLGVRCINSTGSKMEHARVTLVVDVTEEA